MIEFNEQCRKCIHFQVCSSALKEELYLREILLEEENPKCKMFVEVVHGRWERMVGMMPPEYHGRHECSCCGVKALDWKFHEELSNYCPNCGVKMDGDKYE